MEIIYKDRDIVVVSKDAGEIVHAAPGCDAPVMADILVKMMPEMASVGSKGRPGVVHRLDRDTSGVMVFARSPRAYACLRRQFESHADVEKVYLAVCHGAPPEPSGTFRGPAGRDRRLAVTHWTQLARRNALSLVEFKIETGRMHQIRIHAAELGCPIAGDAVYGKSSADRSMRRRPARTLLHAVRLSFVHPATGRRVSFASHPPADLVYAV